jgi:hypothetical protein
VMPLIWALLYCFEGTEMSLFIFYPSAVPWKCGNWSGGDTRPTAKNSDGTVMPMIFAIYCCFQGFETSLIIIYPSAVPWKCGNWSGGDTRPTAKNSDETLMEQWCLWIELFYVVLNILRCYWSFFILLQCIGSVVIDLVLTQDLLPKTVMEQWWNSDETVMRHWWNSDAYELSYFLLFWRFWDVIYHILAFCNALEVW